MYLFKKDYVIKQECVVISNAFIFVQLLAKAKPVNPDPD